MDARRKPSVARGRGQRIIARVFWAIAAIAGLAVALLLLAHTPPARRFAANQVATLLADRQIFLQSDELRYNLFSLSFDLRNLRLTAAASNDLPTFATIERAHLELSLPDLLRRRYVVRSASAEGVTVHYVVREDGVDNLPRPPSDPNQPQGSVDFLIADFRIPSAHVRYEDRRQPIDIVLPQASVEVTGSRLTNRHEVKLDVGAGQAKVKDRTATLDAIAGTLSIGDDDVNLEAFEVRALASRIAIDGAIGPFDAPAADLRVRGHVDMAHAASFADAQQAAIGGQLVLAATVQGPLAEPSIDARVQGSGLSVEELAGAQLDLIAAYDTKTRRARVSTLRVEAPWGTTAGEGELSLDRSQPSRIRASIDALDVGALSKAWQAAFVPATRVAGTVQAEWPGLDYLAASGDADLRMTATQPQASPSVMPLAGQLALRARDGRFEARIEQLRAAGADVRGRVAMSPERALDGKLRVDVANIGLLARSLEALLNRASGSLMPAGSEGSLSLEATVGGSVSAPTATATASAPAVTIGGASGIALNAEASVDSSRLTIRSADLNWQQARVQLAGSAELADARRLDLTLNAADVALSPVLQAFDVRDTRVSGVLDAQATVGGTMAQPVARATVQGRELAVFDEPFGRLKAELNLAGREVVLSLLEIDKPQPDGDGLITGRGSYHLDRGSYSVDFKTQGVRLQQLLLPGGERVRGNLQFVASGAGTVESPSGKLSLTIDPLEVDTPPRTQPADSASYLPATLALGRVVLDGVAAGKQATITASASQFNLDLRALVGLERPWPTTLDLRANDLSLAALPLVVSSPLDGSLRMALSASGDLSQPSRGNATVDVEALAGSWGGQPFRITSPARIRYADEQLVVERLELAARDAALQLTGSLPLTPRAEPGRITVDARAQLAALAQYLPTETNITGDGVVTLSGSIAGTLQAIDPSLLLVVEDGLVLTPQLEPGLSNLTLRMRVADGEAQIEQFDANWGAAKVEASGRIPFEALPELPIDMPRKSGPSTFKAAIRELNPAAIPGAPRGLGGRIALDAQLSAQRAELAAVEGRLTFPELALTFGNLGLEQQKSTTIALGSGTATLEDVNLSGSLGSLGATGTISLVGERPVALDVDGTLDVGALSVLTDAVQAEGHGKLRLAARGTIAAPELNGYLELADVTVVSDEPNIAAEHLNARIDLLGRQVTLTQLTADVNGGTLEGRGTATLGSSGLEAIDVQASTRDFAFDAPLDLRSLSNATLSIHNKGDEIIVGGQITIDEAGLTGDFNFDEGLLAAMTARPELNLTRERNPLLERVRFDVHVDTATPVVVDNNIARAEVAVDVRVVGTPYQPGLTGRVTVLEGGEVTLNERRFEAERAIITFVDERRIQPSLDLLLNTSAGNYDIDVAVTGAPGETETTLTSDPSLPEPDIMAMLVTGRTLDEMRGEEFEVAREQVLSYLTGRVGSKLGSGLERATGLSEVRIEPNLIANEADPSARLTIGQELTDDLNLVYSTSLTDSDDQIWVAEYDVTRRFQTRGVRQSDNSFRFDFSHDVRFGGVPAPRRLERARPAVKSVTISNESGGDESQLRDLLEIEPGDAYDFFAIRRGLQRVEDRLIEQDHLQSRVRLDRQVEAESAALGVHVRRGPLVDIQFDGATPPPEVRESVRRQWHRGVFDKQRGDAGAAALRAWLMQENHLQASVAYRIDESPPDRRRVTFTVQPGPRYQSVALAFEGVAGIDPDRLDRIIESQRLERQLFTDPVVVTELLRRYYRDQGYLAAEVDVPRYDFQGTAARVVIPVREGPRFSVGSVTASGNRLYDTATLLPRLPLTAGTPFLPSAAERSLDSIRDLYWQRGYNSVRSDYALTVDEIEGRVDVAFTVAEGPQSVIAEIAVEGNQKTSERLVREQVELEASEPLDLGLLARSRRNLYDTGAFSIVDITREELAGDVPATTEPPAETQAADQVPVRLNVSVREVQPFQVRYGASYDTERGVGGILDISNYNSFGKARVLGLQSRYDRQLREARLYMSQPSLRYFPLTTTASLYYREELNPPTEITDSFDINRKGVSIQQELELRDSYIWSYGYRYERAQTLRPSQPLTLTPRITVSPVTSTLTRDTRDEVLDASTGSFLSQAIAYSPSWLGSDLPFLKYYGQHFFYFPLRAPQEEPLTRERQRARWVFATGVRVGLAYAMGGDEVPASERFFAGGSTTLRGFAQNGVGPIGTDRVPTGGNALFVLNNEVRVPLVSIVDGVLFADIGNVFDRVSDFSLSDLRKSGGVGLRIRTPWFLLRGDYGLVLDHRPGERRSRFYFSIGQAF